MSSVDLSSLKYNELQKLAKKHGVKANMKIDKLRAALAVFYSKENSEESPTKSTGKNGPNVKNEKTPVQKLQKQKSSSKVATPQSKKNASSGTIKSGKLARAPFTSPSVKKPLSSACTPSKSSTPAKKIQHKVGDVSTNNTSPKSSVSTPVQPKGRSQNKRKSTETECQSGGPTKRARRGTFDCEPTPKLQTPEITAPSSNRKKSSSPSTKQLVESMKSDMSAEEMKQSLMAAIDEKIKLKGTKNKSDQKEETKETQIPRFVAFLAKRKQDMANTTEKSPSVSKWSKIHQKNFDKMESIDDYLERKRKRQEEVSSSIKKTRKLLEETRMTMKKLQAHDTPEECRNKRAKLFPTPGSAKKVAPFKPSVLSTKEMNLNFSKSKTPQTSTLKPFKPTNTSTKDMNLNFSKVKTPQNMLRKSPRSANRNENIVTDRKSTGCLQKKSVTTPFKFTANSLNQTMNNTMSAKKTFDLKASLSRPITWKAHKGKLKPFTVGQNTSVSVESGRDARQMKQMKKRTDSKFNSSIARRGIQI